MIKNFLRAAVAAAASTLSDVGAETSKNDGSTNRVGVFLHWRTKYCALMLLFRLGGQIKCAWICLWANGESIWMMPPILDLSSLIQFVYKNIYDPQQIRSLPEVKSSRYRRVWHSQTPMRSESLSDNPPELSFHANVQSWVAMQEVIYEIIMRIRPRHKQTLSDDQTLWGLP